MSLTPPSSITATQQYGNAQLKQVVSGQDTTDVTNLGQVLCFWVVKNLNLTSSGQTILLPAQNGTGNNGYKFVPVMSMAIELLSITGTLTTPK